MGGKEDDTMKRLVLFAAILALLALPSVGESAAVGTCGQSVETPWNQSGGKILIFRCTASADDGSFPSTDTSAEITAAIEGLYIAEVRVNPGTAPTTLYDIVLNDVDGIDLMGGTMADRSATVSQRSIPAVAPGIYGGTLAYGPLTLAITGNLVNSAVVVVKVFLAR